MEHEKTAMQKMASMILIWTRGAWEDTINLEKEKLHFVYDIWSGCVYWGFTLMNTKSPSSYIALETQIDMEASTLLALSGFYRHANIVLRGWLELTFLGLWFDENMGLFDKWIKGVSASPFKNRSFFKKSWLVELLKKPSFKKFEIEYKLSKESMELYRELSKATHAMSEAYHETIDRGDTVTRYRKKSFEKWFLNLKQVFETTSTGLALKYPSIFKVEQTEMKAIRQLLSKERLRQLGFS